MLFITSATFGIFILPRVSWVGNAVFSITLEFVESGLEVFEFGSIQFPASAAFILPLAVNVHGQNVFSAWFVVNVVRERFQIPSPALQYPDRSVECINLVTDFHVVCKGEVFSGDGIPELWFGLRRGASSVGGIVGDALWPSPAAEAHAHPELLIVLDPCDQPDFGVGINSGFRTFAVVYNETVVSDRGSLLPSRVWKIPRPSGMAIFLAPSSGEDSWTSDAASDPVLQRESHSPNPPEPAWSSVPGFPSRSTSSCRCSHPLCTGQVDSAILAAASAANSPNFPSRNEIFLNNAS